MPTFRFSPATTLREQDLLISLLPVSSTETTHPTESTSRSAPDLQLNMCYSQTIFYHSCQHYGATPVISFRCIRANTLPSSSKGCEDTESLGVIAKYDFCPRCTKEPSFVPLPSSPTESESSQATSSTAVSQQSSPSRAGGRPRIDTDYFNGLVRRHAATSQSSSRRS